MDEAINRLYTVFAPYRLGNDFTGCDCCVNPEHSARLASKPLRELTYSDLELYASKALTTWGDTHHFKYFLPRLLELTIAHRDDFLDLAVVFGKLSYAQFGSWPQYEREAVMRFFEEYWQLQLREPIRGPFEDSIDTALCAIANALSSVQPFLDQWLNTLSDNAKRHLAAFILKNDAALVKRHCLSNAFWDTTGRPHQEVVQWLLSDDLLHYFDGPGDAVFKEDFAYAWPRLMAIRASFAHAST